MRKPFESFGASWWLKFEGTVEGSFRQGKCGGIRTKCTRSRRLLKLAILAESSMPPLDFY